MDTKQQLKITGKNKLRLCVRERTEIKSKQTGAMREMLELPGEGIEGVEMELKP